MTRLVFACLVIISAAACEEQEGDRCQTNEDCASPLSCNKAKGTCQDPGALDLIDAAVIDAVPDAPPDAP